jgi:hypothetical protein
MFTKSAHYYWDAEAVREPQQLVSLKRAQRAHSPYNPGFPSGPQNHISDYNKKTEGKSVEEITEMIGGSNLRSVWNFSTHGYSGAHFATFPEALPERCIKAATPEAGCCAECGEPWVRIVEHKNMEIRKTKGYAEESGNRTATAGTMINQPETQTLGWQPSCKCQTDRPPVPSVVLDPFAGSGTTLYVAAKLNRRSVGYEISEEYCRLIIKRNQQHVLTEVQP